MSDEQVKVEGNGRMMTVVGGDGAPWWIKYSMQAGFLFVLVMVLWGAYDLMKHKLPTIADPIVRISESIAQMQTEAKDATDAQERIAAATEVSSRAETEKADAARKQADAIERWVNLQSFRVTSGVPKGFFDAVKPLDQP